MPLHNAAENILPSIPKQFSLFKPTYPTTHELHILYLLKTFSGHFTFLLVYDTLNSGIGATIGYYALKYTYHLWQHLPTTQQNKNISMPAEARYAAAVTFSY